MGYRYFEVLGSNSCVWSARGVVGDLDVDHAWRWCQRRLDNRLVGRPKSRQMLNALILQFRLAKGHSPEMSTTAFQQPLELGDIDEINSNHASRLRTMRWSLAMRSAGSLRRCLHPGPSA